MFKFGIIHRTLIHKIHSLINIDFMANLSQNYKETEGDQLGTHTLDSDTDAQTDLTN